MQDINYEQFSVNLNPRPTEYKPFPEEFKTGLAYLAAIATKKRHAASLIVNLYNSNIVGADMNGLAYYCRGENCKTLYKAMFNLITCCAYVESHEIYGKDFVEGLINQWGFRE
ncbi:hypothetical protein [Vibrio jasicida]|uniref:Uncharacterized protein n=1 Tax=Vibrio jasicida TaxID=766224 RepID=A0ABW7JFH5_9VIBR